MYFVIHVFWFYDRDWLVYIAERAYDLIFIYQLFQCTYEFILCSDYHSVRINEYSLLTLYIKSRTK